MSVREFIHPGWFAVARAIEERRLAAELRAGREEEARLRGTRAEPHAPGCGGEAIGQNGRCLACGALRIPRIPISMEQW